MRVACYIDGFNLYHSIDDLGKPHLKWVDLWGLSKSLCRNGETLVKVAYFSAFATWKPASYARHRQYVAALKHTGVDCHIARFSAQSARCFSCHTTWTRHEEKETDVHFSLTFLEDAIDDVFDRAIIISADSDHVPAVRKVRARLPSKQIFAATPPGRHAHAREMINNCNSATNITAGRVARNLFPQTITDASGTTVAVRPPSYDPPVGWAPPP
ncbi:NYN domain-containing protein [Bradyrhizobium sp. SZCCHNS2015]|uniref:NYN domain-containing protein n=1 Tax=Bradyrhizobium sp. SZCCHNS2015 TaxID=3057305 RepID=UPI0028E341D5|nr:NYN domain-containing protein [Bradyrhizobium sp. SZCCHNS2015]